MGSNMVSLEIDEDMVKSALNSQIAAAIVQQLGDQDELITGAVKVALSKKVDSDGKVNEYSSYNRNDLLEVLATKSIHAAAKEALDEWIEENRSKIKEAVLKELDTPSRQRKIAVAYVNAIDESIKCNWRMDCNIQFIEKDE